MKIKKNTLAFFCLYSAQFYLFISYLFINIKNIGGEGGALLHIIAFYITSIIIFVMIALKKSLVINGSFLLLSTVILWIAIKILGDIGNYEYLKKFMFATTGGILFFYFCGLFLSISSLELIDLCLTTRACPSRCNILKSAIFIFLIFVLYRNIDLFLNLKERLRDDLFIIKNVNGSYQRPGNFLSISFLLTSYLYVFQQIKNFYIKNNKKLLKHSAVLIIYLCIMIMSSISAQMMGSNNAFIIIIGTGIITLIITSIVLRNSIKNKYSQKPPLNRLIIKKLLLKSISISLIIMIIAVLLIVIFNFDISKTRFMGYGTNTNTSLESRLTIIQNNFLIHFNDSPIIGNYNVEQETTGIGTYIHSFFLQSLTHTGVVGFLMFLILFVSLFISLGVKNTSLIYKHQLSLPLEKPIKLFSLLILMYFLLVANIATVITWPVLWFGLGMLSYAIVFKKY